jgi:hypothetical protein
MQMETLPVWLILGLETGTLILSSLCQIQIILFPGVRLLVLLALILGQAGCRQEMPKALDWQHNDLQT